MNAREQLAAFERLDLPGAGCRLSALAGGDPAGRPVLVLHGMRDNAVSMTFLVEHLPDHRIILLDLRGHGDSEYPGQYGAFHMVADVKSVIDHLALQDLALVGHSLGGHIASRFTSLYPGCVSKLVMLDGMGPPGNSSEPSDDALGWRLDMWRGIVDHLTGQGRQTRMMTDIDEALMRFGSANPGVSAERAGLLVETGTRQVPGGITWKFDTGLEMFWTGLSVVENEAAMAAIPCPVLIVTGEHSLDYWSVSQPGLKGQQQFYEAELERRRRLFADARHEVLKGAGHMLHYDQPQALGEMIRGFLNGQ